MHALPSRPGINLNTQHSQSSKYNPTGMYTQVLDAHEVPRNSSAVPRASLVVCILASLAIYLLFSKACYCLYCRQLFTFIADEYIH
jgi:hypothetical protein